ncbi:MAG: hypothetical protein AVDCRST_MAG27-1291, partial [uncultured Craurococcus sp.]
GRGRGVAGPARPPGPRPLAGQLRAPRRAPRHGRRFRRPPARPVQDRAGRGARTRM